MHRGWFLTLRAILFLVSLPALYGPVAEADDVERVLVTNFPELQRVQGSVRIPEPVPATALSHKTEIVGPVARTESLRLTDGGILDATGFGSAVFSLAGFVKGPLSEDGIVGVILVPEVEEITRVRAEEGKLLLPITVSAAVTPVGEGLFAAQTAPVPLGFPRYRILFFNESQRTVEATLYAYLGSR